MSNEKYPILDVVSQLKDGSETYHFVWITEDEMFKIFFIRSLPDRKILNPHYPMSLTDGSYYVYFDGVSYVCQIKDNQITDYE